MFNRPVLFALIALAIVSRLIPHPPNFVFMGALGLFVGCHFRGVSVVLIPLLAMLVSDTIGHVAGISGMGFYHLGVMATVYVAISVSGLVGMSLRGRQSAVRVASASLFCSTLFFVISNFGVWAVGSYPPGAAGLVSCYTAALPFFQYTLAGDLVYSTLTFGTLAACQWLGTKAPLNQLARVSL